ncbi:MAG: Oligopeptide ABC transporter, periplasmic oligopeptide-binding protein OppA [uncultured Thermomicrobiales bacterium]|uniref:Oligopeptide ABC transporter, periplasmic oligopeptide-binding protein OppA n=1 Tax=uncultured Thermomicrobiales bacterium TaxID=1645740 RepID=A0A6J4VNS9_9BACT|nr:MAG: Oligopeptide ABC transporter, periplasmic oligopeptide-binding protein OppA [uncultured Thermomicrobiales bacterium]
MQRFSARWARLAALLVAVTLVGPTAVAGVAAAAQDAEGKVLRVHHITYPDDFDPQKSSFSNEIDILALAYEGLTRQDTELNTVPGAAESWEFNDDGTVITFKLREGLTFSDGSPLTAENFRYAIERTCDPNTAGEYQSILDDIVGCADFYGLNSAGEGTPVTVDEAAYEEARSNIGARAIDDRTLEVTLRAPAPYFPTLASLWVFFPVKPELVEEDPDNWWQDPANHVGNGPFTITGIEEEQLITFEANEEYWGGRPQLDGIEYVYQPETAVALEAFRSGDLDIAQLDPSQLPEVEGDPEYLAYPVAFTGNLAFNLTQEPFTDKKVREAFSMAFDRETYCATIRNGDCTPTLSWIPEGIPGSIETDKYGFDAEAAVQALAESSYGGPEGLPEIRMFYNSDDPAATPRAEWVAGQYRDILGVEITLEPTEGTALVDLRKNPETFPQSLLVGGWYQDYPDPQNWLSVYWRCDATFAQRFAYCNEEFDKLVEQGDTTLEPEARTPFYEQASQILVDDVPGPFLYNLNQTVMVSENVTGYTATNLDAEWPGQFTSLLTLDKTEDS